MFLKWADEHRWWRRRFPDKDVDRMEIAMTETVAVWHGCKATEQTPL